MFQRSRGLLAVAAALLVLGGCVAKSDYLRKQAEADALSRDGVTRTAENQGLQERIRGLQENIRRLQEEISDLHAAKENLTAERYSLNVRLSTLKEETNRTIEELRNRNNDLDGDKQMLEENIALLKKSKEELMTRNNLLDADKQILEESIALLKKSKEELMTRNTELESDMQMIEESIALLKDSKEAEVNTVSRTYEELLGEMKDEIEQGKIAITELQGKLTMDVFDKILFDSGRTEVKPGGLAILKRIIKILITVTDKVIRIEGHTDNIPITGALAKKYPTNRELSAARALNVTRYLEKGGIDPSILSAEAFGEYQPIAENDTPEGRAKNRRIAIILLPMK
ncbi:MAG: OmpA family protein [Deltaproteobacteria bacterium]|nr:OmpA family protein [Deltaproteobacteria bacterium]